MVPSDNHINMSYVKKDSAILHEEQVSLSISLQQINMYSCLN